MLELAMLDFNGLQFYGRGMYMTVVQSDEYLPLVLLSENTFA